MGKYLGSVHPGSPGSAREEKSSNPVGMASRGPVPGGRESDPECSRGYGWKCRGGGRPHRRGRDRPPRGGTGRCRAVGIPDEQTIAEVLQARSRSLEFFHGAPAEKWTGEIIDNLAGKIVRSRHISGLYIRRGYCFPSPPARHPPAPAWARAPRSWEVQRALEGGGMCRGTRSAGRSCPEAGAGTGKKPTAVSWYHPWL